MSDVTRVTLVLPSKLWKQVEQIVPAGQRSRLVAEALELELRRRRRQEQLARLRQLQDYLLEKYAEMPDSADEINRMREEHDADLTDLQGIC